MNKMFHLFSEGDVVLFRNNDDYIAFNNKLATSAYLASVAIIAETIMSTHFHCIAECTDVRCINDFQSLLHKSWMIYFSKRHPRHCSSILKIGMVEITSREMLRTETAYVLKNPVHHYSCVLPLSYRFSSAAYMHPENIIPGHVWEGFINSAKPIAQLSGRIRRNVTHGKAIPGEWRVSQDGMILPSSYVNIPRAKAIWDGNVKSFLFDMNKNGLDADKRVINIDILDLRASTIDDMQACRIIDDYCTGIGVPDFTLLNPQQLKRIRHMLASRGANAAQIRRCLWIDENGRRIF